MKGCNGFTTKNIKQIIDYKNGKHETRDKALILLGIATGMRISELLSLKIKDVRNKNGSIKEIIHLKKENTKKKVEGASFKLPDYTTRAIANYIENRKNIDNDQLF